MPEDTYARHLRESLFFAPRGVEVGFGASLQRRLFNVRNALRPRPFVRNHQIGVDIDSGYLPDRRRCIHYLLSLSIPCLSPLGSGTPQQGRVPTPPGEYTTSPSTPLDEPSPTGCALIFAVRVPSCQGRKILCASTNRLGAHCFLLSTVSNKFSAGYVLLLADNKSITRAARSLRIYA